MGRERPEDVLLGADLPEVQAIRVDVLDAAELSLVDQALEPQDGGVVPEQVANHEHSSVARGEARELFTLLDRKAQRLFDEYVLARHKGSADQLPMRLCGGGDRHTADLGIREDLIHRVGDSGPGISRRELGMLCRIHFANPGESVQRVKVTDEVTTPVAGTDTGNLCLNCHELPVFECAPEILPPSQAPRGPSSTASLFRSSASGAALSTVSSSNFSNCFAINARS